MPISDDELVTTSEVLKRVGVWLRCKVVIIKGPDISFRAIIASDSDLEAFDNGEWPGGK